MVIVGINDGHNASVCITKDSKIFFALSEERPSRIKISGACQKYH